MNAGGDMARLILAFLLLVAAAGNGHAEAGRSPKITAEPRTDVDFDTAYAAHSRGDLDQAILFYDKVIRTGGLSRWTAAIVLTDRGVAYLDKGRLDRAIADFD